MKDYSKQIGNLTREITEAIIGLLQKHGRTEIEFPECDSYSSALDAVYVIFFSNSGDPYECVVNRIAIDDDSISISATDKNDGYRFETDNEYCLSSRSPIWLNEIYIAAQVLLEPECEPLKT